MRLLPMRKRLLLLGLLGVMMTLSVAGAALVSLRDVSAINRELTLVNRVLRFHQDADMMHDALRADVARAHLAGHDHAGYVASNVRKAARRHAARLRRDLQAIDALRLSPRPEAAVEGLRAQQRNYVQTAVEMVDTALTEEAAEVVRAQVTYEVAFQQLVPTMAEATRELMRSTKEVKRAAAVERAEAERVITIATILALAGWVGLVTWHHHSMGKLQGALVREAEQRSAAEVLQRSLLPTHLPDVPGIELAARSIPGSSDLQVGGDWYDVLSLPTGEVCLVVGDVAGHDLPAAAMMGQVRNALRAYALEDPEPMTVLGRVNRAACLLDAPDLTTSVCVVVNPVTMTLKWASAGHLSPLVLSAADGGRLLSGEPGPPLGVEPAAVYHQHTARLEPGDTLLLYTDGLVERRGVTIDVGLAALQNLTVEATAPDDVCDQVLEALADDSAERDDVTCLVLHLGEREPSCAGMQGASPAVARTRLRGRHAEL